ncbi:asparagine synthase (glutamine-hydrolyzing) [Pantoea agglomerans]|uniref:asparagine synthase (glutamine-hydrolyzing) n=1 Tax=Enterobacter agglomerans TaxID=549 RepID=UPI001782A6EF|nr:asparagine synthase (glutamine-hydrolyzing) [Pantoea agglomerans]MBD8158028.1 asparagine synthase (glutamine-hydrolyzing) [Pantoea agglomerans]MBD8233100.1 asparagine synthase (glutamine-hydrolyzing) [Pantoea agglomerans]
MCGIAGWATFSHNFHASRNELEAMAATMALRGPDASGIWMDRHAGLSHRRLAIVDLEGGVQPMTVNLPGGSVALSYSGEVYNFKELRSELTQLGHVFSTQSDTEVVLKGYLQWGNGVCEKLNGMFGFAIWDARHNVLLLVRDRFGVKPLYYYPTEQSVLFGSEPKAILAHSQVPGVLTTDSLREALGWTKTPGHGTWNGLKEVKPGTYVQFGRDGMREETYWQLQARPHHDSLEKTIENVHALLADTVKRQMVSDVPLCSLLSGGLDSSAIAAIASQQPNGERQLKTFAVDFEAHTDQFVPDVFRDESDAPYARKVAEKIGSRHTNLVLGYHQISSEETRRAVIAARDLPTGFGDADNSIYLLFKAIRNEATVALSGESADEVFGGYRWFHQPEIMHGDSFPWADHTFVTSFKTGLDAFAPDLLASLELPDYVRARYQEALVEVPRLVGEDSQEAKMREVLYLHLTRYMRILLDRKDRLSMAAGLEVRVPFCDHRLVEYVFNTPWKMKTFDGREKSLLRAAMAHLLPQAVLQRKKAPYPAIQNAHYSAVLQRQVADLVANNNHPARDLLNICWLKSVLQVDPAAMSREIRHGLERALDFATWIDLRRPVLKL